MLNDTVACIVGRRGSGKSTYVRQHLGYYEPFLLIDPLQDKRYLDKNCFRVYNYDELLNAIESNKRRIIISVNPDELNIVLRILFSIGNDFQSNFTVIIDEVDKYVDAMKQIPEPIFNLINYGRHKNLSFIAIARRPKLIHKSIRGQALEWIVFPLNPEDYKDLEAITGKKIETLNTFQGGSNYAIIDDEKVVYGKELYKH